MSTDKVLNRFECYIEGADISASKSDTRNLEPCSAFTSLCHTNLPPVGINNLLHYRESQPSSALFGRVSGLKDVILLIWVNTWSVVFNSESTFCYFKTDC